MAGTHAKRQNLPASACIHAADSFAQLGAFAATNCTTAAPCAAPQHFGSGLRGGLFQPDTGAVSSARTIGGSEYTQPEMLAYTEKRLRRQHIDNVDYYLCDGTHFDFPDQSFDRIVLITVLGEVANQAEYLAEFRRLLRPDGLLSVSETAGDPDKPSRTELRDLMRQNGFEMADEYGSERNFTLNFKVTCTER